MKRKHAANRFSTGKMPAISIIVFPASAALFALALRWKHLPRIDLTDLTAPKSSP